MSTSEVERLQKIKKVIEDKKRKEEKALILEKILKKIDFNFSAHLIIPKNLKKVRRQNASFAKIIFQPKIFIYHFLPFQMYIVYA